MRLATVLILSVLFLAMTPFSVVHAKLYKWVDETGTIRYSDNVPPDQAKQGRKEINQQGFISGEVEKAKSPEEIRRLRELEERKKREELIARTQRESDKKLLTAYPNLESLDHAVELKRKNIHSAIRITETRIEKLAGQVNQLEKKAAQKERVSGELPMDLYKEIDSRTHEIETQRQVVIKKNQELKESIAQFEVDRKRYLELVEDE